MKSTKWIASIAVVLICLSSSIAFADGRFGTWNLAWLMDKATHTKWSEACSNLGWRTEEELKAAGVPLPEELKGLPYCDVHSGIDYRKVDSCKKAIGPGYYKRPNKLDSADEKCRTSPDLADWTAYQRKLKALSETWLGMDKSGVTLIALQEAFDESAVRQILPSGWDVKTTASINEASRIPQQIGIAWKVGSVTPTRFELVGALSNMGTRPLRPGLSFKFDIEGKSVDALVVHLKSGCRSVDLSDKKDPDCPVLQKQVPVVERWIEERVGTEFVVLGDFNRSLLQEVSQYPNPDPDRFGSTPVEKIQWMTPEWNDDVPKGSLVQVVPHVKKPDGKLVAGDYFCSETVGIDHVLLSAPLANRLSAGGRGLEVVPVGYVMDGKRLPIGKTTVPPSDHCPRTLAVKQ